MPAKDLYHDIVVAALTADGWVITDDPLQLRYQKRDLYVDLAAERSEPARPTGLPHTRRHWILVHLDGFPDT